MVNQTRAHAFGRTDCALPMVWAKQKDLDVDGFVVYTDNETWAGRIQPSQALKQYRKHSGIEDAALCVQAFTPTKFTIADPKDPRMMDVSGCDTSTPKVVSDFLRG